MAGALRWRFRLAAAAIIRDLARGMGGDLTVESTVEVGSTFTLALPAA